MLGNLEEVEPNLGHYALVDLERIGILKCVITQNIDKLHRKVGSRNVLDYHGNAFRLRCANCNARFDTGEYDLPGLAEKGQLPPYCKKCQRMYLFFSY